MAATSSRNDVIQAGQIDLLVGDVIPLQINRAVTKDLTKAIAEFGTQLNKEIGVSASFSVVDARVLGYLTEFAAVNVKGINATTQRQLSRALAEGVLAGEGEAQLAARVRGVFKTASVTRSKMIARTEVNAAAGFARNQAMQDAGEDIVKARRWFATRDSRTRRNHMRLHNQIRELRKPFKIPGSSKRAMYPGGFADVGENVNCRCLVLPVVEPIKVDAENDAVTIPVESDRQTVEAFDRLVLKWEPILERAFRRGFLAQERAVLRLLKAKDRAA